MRYEKQVLDELHKWQHAMLQKPGVFSKLSKRVQDKINGLIPAMVHRGITATIKQMVRAVLFGAAFTTGNKTRLMDLREKDKAVEEKIKAYQHTAAAEGAITGAGGFLAGLADFPLLLTIKIKLLFEIAAIYGVNVNDYKERLYILHIFQIAFSGPVHRRKVFLQMQDWDERSRNLPADINQFDWHNFRQEYRDYIDLAKMAQLIPVIGAPVGAVVNYRLIKKLGYTAMQAYHMRMMAGLRAA